MKDSAFFHLLLLVAMGVGLLLFVGGGGCTNDDASRRALENGGYTDIELGGYEPFVCGEHDVSHVVFTATNTTGRRVSGVVCCGLMKACTVRF